MKTSGFKRKEVFKNEKIDLSALRENIENIADYDEKIQYIKACLNHCWKVIMFLDIEIEKLIKANEHDPELLAKWMEIKKNHNTDKS